MMFLLFRMRVQALDSATLHTTRSIFGLSQLTCHRCVYAGVDANGLRVDISMPALLVSVTARRPAVVESAGYRKPWWMSDCQYRVKLVSLDFYMAAALLCGSYFLWR